MSTYDNNNREQGGPINNSPSHQLVTTRGLLSENENKKVIKNGLMYSTQRRMTYIVCRRASS